MNESMQKSEVLPLVRSLVRQRLESSPAFKELPREKQRAVAHDTVNALHYILGGADGSMRPTNVTLGGNAEAFAGPAPQPQPKPQPGPNPKPQARQARGLGEAARAGGEAFTDLVEGVNFPAFVGGLIDGVFNSIVTTSIKQMEAYAEMVKNVSKSVDQYMKDNVSEEHARDYLVEKYPDHFEPDMSGEKPKLKPKEGADESNMPDFFADLGLKAPVTSLDEDNIEQQLVPAARQRIAMDRQQLLATMVMMGINRLVVTNGTIEASCFFELDTTDTRKRHDMRTSDKSRELTTTRESRRDGSRDWSGDRSFTNKAGDAEFKSSGKNSGKDSWYSKSTFNDTAKFNVKTVSTRDSEETIKLHGELGGKVKVNFKSDFFPMEKMVDILQVQQIRDKTAAGIAPQTGASALPAPALPALPALPPLPGAPAAAPAPPKTT